MTENEIAATETPVLEEVSAQDFFFGTALYKKVNVSETTRRYICGRVNKLQLEAIDGYCIYCGRMSSFAPIEMSTGDFARIEGGGLLGQEVYLRCTRVGLHSYRFYVDFRKFELTKVGQVPAVAEIDAGEAKPFINRLSKQDRAEFNRAVGLFAHGIGVGSFVYLRRVFERLVMKRFDEFKEAEGWTESEFLEKSMADRVKHLKDHLPAFLVDNARIYSVLSKGIHSLSEEECLKHFDIVRRSILIVLADDQRKADELRERRELTKAIADAAQS